MTPRLFGHFAIFAVWFYLFSSLSILGIARQWSREKTAILSLKPQSPVRIVIYRTWAIGVIGAECWGVCIVMSQVLSTLLGLRVIVKSFDLG